VLFVERGYRGGGAERNVAWQFDRESWNMLDAIEGWAKPAAGVCGSGYGCG